VVGDAFKAFVNGVVVLLAALAFFTVPVGKKTPAQHVVAIFETKPAREAASAFADAARQIVKKVRSEMEDATAPPLPERERRSSR
jgi:hypothetical protein